MKYAVCITLVLCVALAVCIPAAEAAASLKFVATSVYWEDPYKLVVEGYFLNNGTKIITGITYFELTAYAIRGGHPVFLGKGVWHGNYKLENVELFPGDTSNWTFTIHTERYIDFSHWDVKSYYEYNYLK